MMIRTTNTRDAGAMSDLVLGHPAIGGLDVPDHIDPRETLDMVPGLATIPPAGLIVHEQAVQCGGDGPGIADRAQDAPVTDDLGSPPTLDATTGLPQDMASATARP